MNDIYITIFKNGKVSLSNNEIGYNGENNARNLIIELEEEISDGKAVIEIDQHNKKYFLSMEEQEGKYILPIYDSLLAYSEIKMQFRLVKDENIIIKSEIFEFKIDDSINAIDKRIPDEYTDWFSETTFELQNLKQKDVELEQKINEVESEIPDVSGLVKVEELTEALGQVDKYIEKVEQKIPDVSEFITKEVNNLTNYYDKEQIDGKLSSAIHYKGEVDNYSDLEALEGTVEIGDMYNIKNESFKNKAGDNAVWNGTEWDILSGVIDLSDYALKEYVNTSIQNLVDNDIQTLNDLTKESQDDIKQNKNDIKNLQETDETFNERITELEEGGSGGDTPIYYYDGNASSEDNKKMFDEIFEKVTNNEQIILAVDNKISGGIDTTRYLYFTQCRVYWGYMIDFYSLDIVGNGDPSSGGVSYKNINFITIQYNKNTRLINELKTSINAIKDITQLVGKDNMVSWTPSQQYGLVHKKYVDDAVASSGGGASYTAGTNIEITDNNVINNKIPYKITDNYIQLGENISQSSSYPSTFIVGGNNSNVNGSDVYLVGRNNVANNCGGSILVGGSNNIYSAGKSIVLGSNVNTTAFSSYKNFVSIGFGSIPTKNNQIMFGSRNNPYNEMAMFTSDGLKTIATTDDVKNLITGALEGEY